MPDTIETGETLTLASALDTVIKAESKVCRLADGSVAKFQVEVLPPEEFERQVADLGRRIREVEMALEDSRRYAVMVEMYETQLGILRAELADLEAVK